MKHTHSRIWIHIIWTTKNRERILLKEPSKKLYNFLMDKSKELNIEFEQLNIQPEHIHALIDLPTDICLCDFMRKIKGSSSYWINDKKILESKFSWQRGYGAYSVSASQFKKVKNYIKNQTSHHKQKTFIEEYNEWIKEYGVLND